MDLVRSPGRLYPVGRLDADSEGLLLLTNDGELTDRLTHPRYGAQKTYIVLVRGQPSDAALTSLVEGVQLTDGIAHAVEVERSRGVPALAPGMKLHTPAGTTWLVMTLDEGHKREIRRMLTQIGHPVLRLVRVRFGTLELGSLQPGQARALTGDELRRLLQSTHHRPSRQGGQRARAPVPRADRGPSAVRRSTSRPASRSRSRPSSRSQSGGTAKVRAGETSRPRRTRKTR